MLGRRPRGPNLGSWCDCDPAQGWQGKATAQPLADDRKGLGRAASLSCLTACALFLAPGLLSRSFPLLSPLPPGAVSLLCPGAHCPRLCRLSPPSTLATLRHLYRQAGGGRWARARAQGVWREHAVLRADHQGRGRPSPAALFAASMAALEGRHRERSAAPVAAAASVPAVFGRASLASVRLCALVMRCGARRHLSAGAADLFRSERRCRTPPSCAHTRV